MAEGQKSIIVPGSDKPQNLRKLVEQLVDQQRVATLIVRRGERFLLKLLEIRGELVVGEVRCLNWSPEMGRKIYRSFHDDDNGISDRRREVLLADAIDDFAADAHRYRVYIPIDDVTAVYEDIDDRFDETPFLPLP
jgi:hypothetical protein